jgi:hypothetical protein
MKKIVPFLAALLWLGCGPSSKVMKIDSAPGTDFSKYKTFDFFGIEASGDTIPERFNTNLPLLKNAIKAQLEKVGMTQSSSNPDLKVNLGLVVLEKAQTRETDIRTDRPAYTGQRNYTWQSQDVVVGYYKEGTLDVHLVDVATSRMVWQGTVQDILPEKSAKIPQTIEDAINVLFEGFPTRTKGKK